MRVLLFVLITFFSLKFHKVYSQHKLVGTGTLGGGSIFAINEDGSEPEKWADMTYAHDPFFTKLVESNGRLWGMTTEGGITGDGTIFSISIDGTDFIQVHDFDGENGSLPYSGLIESNGKLWGMTNQGGSMGYGIIFSIHTDGSGFTKVHDFDNTNGSSPNGDLVENNGRLWGMTSEGGISGEGVIFNLNIDGTGFTKVHDFDGTNGSGSSRGGSLIESNGKLWGLTRFGGIHNSGTIFSISLDGSEFSKVHDFNIFDTSNGSTPNGSLVESNGKLWGVAGFGGVVNGVWDIGVIFSIDTDGTNFTIVHDFDETNGAQPYSSLIESNGKLWGTTYFGGTSNQGVVFSINTDATGFTKVHDFAFPDGYRPYGNIVESNGKIWGLTRFGGSFDSGVIFNLNIDGTDFSEVHDFSSTSFAQPEGSLIESNKKLWGMALYGGDSDSGVIYNMNVDGSDFSKVHDFDNANGAYPHGSLLESNGRLWGMTKLGGDTDDGVIFSLNSDGTGFTKVHDFDDSSGSEPLGDLIESNGKLWGMTNRGGISDDGIVFSINTDGTGFTKVHDFDDVNGKNPRGSLVESNGKLWGMTNLGGASNHGIVFSINTDGSGFAKVHDFDFTNGAHPTANLIESNGELWGMTRLGGTDNGGAIFSLKTDGTGFTKWHEFLLSDGSIQPQGSLVEFNNKLWGMNFYTANLDKGDIFSINSDGTNFTKVWDFTGEIGGQPKGSLLVVYIDRIAPVFTSGSSLTVDENIEVDNIIYTASSTDEGIVSYSVGGIDAESFNIDTNSGDLTFVDSPDFEVQSTYSITITATDDSDNSEDLDLTIAVNDLDEEAPLITSGPSLSVPENSEGVIYTVSTDEEATFTLGESKDESLFVLSVNTISFISSPDFELPDDSNGDNVYRIDVIATDLVGNESSSEIVITVTDVDDDPLSLHNPNELVFYPNPVKGFFQLKYSVGEIDKVKLLSLDGKMVHSYEVNSRNSYSVMNLLDGTYVVLLQVGGKEVVNGTLVIKN